MKRALSALLAMLVVCAVSALLAWLGGYNFDHRSFEVAAWAGVTLAFALYAALSVWVWPLFNR